MKKFKNLIAILLTLTMVFTLAACGKKEEPVAPIDEAAVTDEVPADTVDPEAPSDAVDGEVNIGVSIYQFNDNFMTLYRKELERFITEDLAARDGVKYNVTVQDGKNDQAEQTNQIQNFITEGYDVLIVNLVQASAGQTVVDMCKAADIPVVFINREPEASVMDSYDKAAYVGADARQSGTYQGELILETSNGGDINGDGVISYVMVQGDPENVDAQFRTEESVAALVAAGKTVNELAMERGDWDQAKGQEIVANFLTQFGSEIEVVFCNNDGMALGAKQAIEAAGRVINEDIYLVGVDALPEVVEFIEAGTFTGTVFNDHYNQAATAAVVAIKSLTENIDSETVDYVKITLDNAGTYAEDAKTKQLTILAK